LNLHGDGANVAEQNVVCLHWVDPYHFAEAVAHEVDVLECAPTNLAAVLEVTNVDSSQAPNVELFVAYTQSSFKGHEATKTKI